MTETTPMGTLPEDTDEISLLDLLQVVADNLRLLILGPLVVGLLALGISFAITPTFTATVKFLPPQQQQSAAAAMLQNLGVLGGLAGVTSGIKNPNDQFIALLKSRSMDDALIDRFDLMERYDKKLRVDARKELDDNTRFITGKENIITIEFDDHDPAFAAQVANAFVEEFRKLLGRLALTEVQQRRVMFEKQLNNAKENLIKAELALKESGVNASALKSAPAAAMGALAQLQAQITAQEVKLASMRGYLADTAPLFLQAQTELAALRSQMTKAENGSTPVKEGDADYVVRYREFKYQETLYELFAKQYELAKVDESREGATIQVVDAAEKPERKTKPKRGIIAVLATIGAGVFLLLFVFVRNAFRTAAQDAQSAAKFRSIKNTVWPRRKA
jgi:tyrosine-protein kinase Etk/Wzc